jgi:hypothetical protein
MLRTRVPRDKAPVSGQASCSTGLASHASPSPHVIDGSESVGNMVDSHANFHELRFGVLEYVHGSVHFAKSDHLELSGSM